MKAKSGLVLYKIEKHARCLYSQNSASITVVLSILSLPNFICAWKYSSNQLVYAPAIAAAISAVIMASIPRKGTCGTCKIPALLYACYYVILSVTTFIEVEVISVWMIPLLFLNSFMLAAGLMITVLLFRRPDGPLYWDLVKDSAFAGAGVDLLQILTALATVDDFGNAVTLNESPINLMLRLAGELLLAFVVMIAMQPQFVSFNYTKIRRSVRDYVRVFFCIALITSFIQLVTAGSIRPVLTVLSVSTIGTQIVLLMAMRRKEISERKWSKNPRKNFIKEFYANKWVITYYDIQDITDIQEKLRSIERERVWLKSLPPTELLICRINRLDADEYALQSRLFWKYSIHSLFP